MPKGHSPCQTEPFAVDADTAATLIASTSAALEKDRATGHMGVPFVRAGRKIIYQLSDLRDWLDENRVTTKSGSRAPAPLGQEGA